LSALAMAQSTRTFNIYFNLNKYMLNAVDKEYIKSEIDNLSEVNVNKIEIIGHTDNSADSLYNIKLSNRRATEVKNALSALGFNENIIEIGYFGENKPIVKNDNEKERKLNRRAEIIVHFTDLEKKCSLGDTIIRTKGGKEIVFDGCEFKEIENCIEIIEQPSQNDFKKGIVVMGKNTHNLLNYGRLQINLLDGCVKNECFKNPVRIRFPVSTPPDPANLPWVLVKGEKTVLRIVEIKSKLFYEFELKCPTSWINCNCKKNQKH
jgi:hypothetical protein